jgi:hypothetical protein
MSPVLPPAAIERAREIAESAPAVSDAKLARLRMLLHGSPAGVAPEPQPAEAA